MKGRSFLLCGSLASLLVPALLAQPFRLPTHNRALFEPGREDRFFVGTVGKPWMTGCFGCVRSDGWQMHEGLDIKCLERDAQGEPTDPVMATADGTVAYLNTKAALSNYGKYVVLRHRIDGLEVFSNYAHLSAIRPGLRVGQAVQAGEPIGTMGRSANTREGISKERAHLHFEINLLLNDRFAVWYRKTHPGERNDHGAWNGQNLAGLDSRLILLAQARQGTNFSLLTFVRSQTALCRVLVRDTSFPWLKRYPLLIRRNPLAEKEGVAGFEIALNYNGVPFLLIPRAAREIHSHDRVQLLSVNEAEYRKNPCRKLIVKRGVYWELARHGTELLDLLTH